MLPGMTGSLDRIASCGVLPVVELPTGADPIALIDALLEGGLDTVEITFRSPGAVNAISAIRAARPDVLVAAGTVLTTEQVDAAIGAGAGLLAPGFSPRVVEHALKRGVEILPGISTPTEVEMGLVSGLETFKFFPAQAAGGRQYLAALAGPYPRVRFVPTGGIDASTLAAYLELPNVLACGGSWMVARGVLESGDMATVRRLASEAKAIVGRRLNADAAADVAG
jgi:2-dehydro-3-deoxyphosphogluconate aldolase/(4S)-4-hydroxy-2-oxoglutarate aldolase